MIIDARNAVYRAVYAGLADERFMESGDDFSVIFFRFVTKYLNQFKPQSVHFFWDCPKETVWRKKIYPEYKDGRDVGQGGRFDYKIVGEAVSRCCDVAKRMIPFLNSRNYYRARQEADDLIYAFCRQCSQPAMIVSSDSDFRQIPFRHRNISLFNPLGKANQVNICHHGDEDIDPTELKSYMGEKSDNIDGYFRIGPVNARKLALDFEKRREFFETYGSETYLRNKALIDLSVCPYILANMAYVNRVLAEEVSFNEKAIRETIIKYKVKGLQGEFTRSLLPFKFLGK
jgi:5'-3' exonuclease